MYILYQFNNSIGILRMFKHQCSEAFIYHISSLKETLFLRFAVAFMRPAVIISLFYSKNKIKVIVTTNHERCMQQ